MKTNLWFTALLLGILNLLIFNNNLTAQSIVGKWLFFDGSETVEFAEEGVFRVFIENQGYSYGIYEFNNDELNFIFFDTEQFFSYAVNNLDKKQLILYNLETHEQMVYQYLGKHEIPADEIAMMLGVIDNDEVTEENFPGVEESWELSKEENVPPVISNNDKVENRIEEAEPKPQPDYPSTDQSNSNIAGTWYCQENNITMTLTGDYYFVRSIMADELLRDIYPDPELSYGRYKFKDNKLTLLTFSNILTGKEEILVENLDESGFVVPIDFYGDKTYQRWVYTGTPRLSQHDQEMLLSWTNYLKLPGQWLAKEEVLKFMGDAILFAGKPGSSGSMLVYGVDGHTLEVSEFGAEKGKYVYKGKIIELTENRLVLEDLKDGSSLAYILKGKPKLTEQEIALYSRYLQMQHRTTMDIIDVIDGVKDWKWVEKEY